MDYELPDKTKITLDLNLLTEPFGKWENFYTKYNKVEQPFSFPLAHTGVPIEIIRMAESYEK